MAEKKNRPSNERTVYIQPTTGGQIVMKVAPGTCVTNLRRAVANRIKVPKDRIILLHKNKLLAEGTLEDNHVAEGSRLTLLPSVETGLLNQKPEQCVMQALETLNDNQVDSFLTGKSPLNLSMRLGDHMMFIQLQLSNLSPSCSARSTSSTTSTSSIPTPPTTPTSPTTTINFPTPVPPTSVPPSPPPSPKMTVPPTEAEIEAKHVLNTSILREASRNLTHTLKQLSSSTLNKKMNESCDGRCCTRQREGGAVIETMFHHGKGVYSGTFSGTLSPSIQDNYGRPRRDITTIIYILNDLLGASSHCRRPSAQCLCSPNTSHTSSTPTSSQVQPTNIKAEVEEKQEENKVLRQKVEQIQTMLEERRQRRKARRNVRSSPYPTSVIQESKSNPTNEQDISDFSSGTAVA